MDGAGLYSQLDISIIHNYLHDDNSAAGLSQTRCSVRWSVFASNLVMALSKMCQRTKLLCSRYYVRQLLNLIRKSSIHPQILLNNESASGEEGLLYVLQLKQDTNKNGLKVFVGGQPLTSKLYFPHFLYGSAKVVVEVFRGPNVFDYINNPITLIWGSACQDEITVSTIALKPQFLKPCAKVEFHSSISSKPFAITPSS